MAADVGDALNAKLRATAAVTAVVGTRISPQLNTEEPALPLILYTVEGADSPKTLGRGSGTLKAYTVRVDCYGSTEAEARGLAAIVFAAICPATPWRDLTAGVHGCFYVDGSRDYTDDAFRFASESYSIWFRPTS